MRRSRRRETPGATSSAPCPEPWPRKGTHPRRPCAPPRRGRASTHGDAMLDTLLFGALPYVAIVLFLVVSIQRYRRNPFSFSSLSSQFLETRRLFWGSVPFHVGILAVFLGHLTGFLFPQELVLWNRLPVRLLVFEVTGLAFALLALVGLAGLLARRAASAR